MRYLVVEIAPGNDEPTFYGSDDGDAVRQLASVLEQGSRVFVMDMATGYHLTSVEATLAALREGLAAILQTNDALDGAVATIG